MTTQRFVRAARAADVPTIARVQVEAWRTGYGPALPAAVVAELTSPRALAGFEEQWREAVEKPPTDRHRVLVATDEREIAGFAAFGPAGDPDRWPRTDAELLALHVDPARVRQGHGSRLSHAVVDHLLDDSFTAVYTWVLAADNPLRSFLDATGWGPDGATREIDMGEPVAMVRYHTAISPTQT
ncbi:GNAT family N-acetyltransferase [Allonocardiopsis opalescens]|uniref:Ribosomal protein S18 acetylase RimI-like enzyme n=1 Tax=Allonocardiopsis opalescens TaxID=1144618 RepID=A0A2T0QFI9_9ACTN|nr:GNAT family N-acetyltransferase [Allonocardiopsis opalescens]PRY02621.1 ribosomal protein S18 acetylase RimI-like enzyme [Allonocardiopsis opalescens]